MDPSQIRKKIVRFRILIIGRVNAGKTTILQRVCNTRDNPEIRDGSGKLIDPALLEASRERGLHDIENEMVFQSNPGFIFHDSRGFEAGGESEFDQVKAFIARRSKEPRLKHQLHAIWYCIPMDEAHRAFTEGEVKFFSQCDTGSIPVIVLFTKFDALYDIEFEQLSEKGTPWKEAKELAPKHAEESFAKGPQLKFLYHSKDIRRPPKCHVCLPNMDEADADCGSLIELTAGTLDNEVLQQLFVSTQQTNLELCMKYAIERTLASLLDSAEAPASGGYQKIVGRLGGWFPYIWVEEDFDWWREEDRWWDDEDFDVSVSIVLRARAMLIQVIARCSQSNELGIDLGKTEVSFFVVLRLRAILIKDVTRWQNLDFSNREEMQSRILAVASGSSPLENIVQLSSAAVIIFEHSFYVFDKRRYLQDKQKSVPSFYVSLEQYTASPRAVAVRKGVSNAIQAYQGAVTAAARTYEECVTTAAHAYEEAVRAGVYAYQGNLPAWMAKIEPFKRKAKQSFERSKGKEKEAFERSKRKEKESVEHSQRKEKESSCSQAKAEFIKTILEITLDHRLPRP